MTSTQPPYATARPAERARGWAGGRRGAARTAKPLAAARRACLAGYRRAALLIVAVYHCTVVAMLEISSSRLAKLNTGSTAKAIALQLCWRLVTGVLFVPMLHFALRLDSAYWTQGGNSLGRPQHLGFLGNKFLNRKKRQCRI